MDLYLGAWHPSRGRIETLLAYDPMSDLAVVKLNAKISLPSVKLGHSGAAKAQQRVYVAGNTMCGGISVSDGTVNRLFLGNTGELKLIQHSAASAPGSQGGPIFLGDEVIGVQRESHREYEIHYAVPVDCLKSLLETRRPQHLGDVFPEADTQIDKRLVHMFSLAGLIAPADEEGPGRDSHHTDLPWPGMDLQITAEADGMQDIALYVVRPTEYGLDPLGAADEHQVGGETLYVSTDDFYRDDPQYLVIHVLNLSTAPVKYGLSLYWIRW
ncbi:MAG: serine protease [bacterium]